MKTLDEHNRDKRLVLDFVMNSTKPVPNGIECPVCKQELMDSDPGVILLSSPPQYTIHCPACNFDGHRY